MNVSKRTLKGLDLGDSAKVLEKKMTFFFAQPQVPCRGPAGGPLGWKKHKYLQKKLAPYCFIANTSVFSTPGDPPAGELGYRFFFGNSTDICVKIGQVWTSLDKFGQI